MSNENMQEQPSRRRSSGKATVTKKKNNKKKNNVVSNIILIIGVLGMVIGGYILVSTLWNEWQRENLRKTYIVEAYEVVEHENKITREEFAPADGERVGVLEIPSQGMVTPIVEGTRYDDLFAASGHEATTSWPGDQKQVFLTGHRNTDFAVLKNIQPGDEIIMKMQYGDFVYKITDTAIVSQYDVHVIDPETSFEKDQLVLMTCYPFTFGADTEERFLVYAERVIE